MSDDIPTNVTGGELNTLWRVANIQLPSVENAYTEPITEIHKVNGDPNDQKYGRCHPWWSTVACLLERAMFSTSGSLYATQVALNRAIDAYTRVDGNNAKALTKVGEDLEKILTKEGSRDDLVERDLPKDYRGPNFNQPDSWSEVHNDD
ncbi:hypothetical protein FB566_3971 [Stackebrandtia endophytica]|uniref:Excreted virulence factor EspC (Type VII ESX diderm) n=1 Tax=Stackebrandtia endophytica TaxID=1496996 RepID=A0A543B0M1_9ACTN|nr:hypothetical protein [Stackebrandtia endophytica]TQL78385.1 hypothetical protein FB566_3971 [Stackebrandtia endophytica]